MRLQIIIKNVFRREVSWRIDRIINTLLWMILPKDKIIVLNVWLKHRGNRLRSVNFGDDLNFVVVTSLSQKRVVSYMHSYLSIFKPRNVMCIGSIVDTLSNENSTIWGSGAIYGDDEKMIKRPARVCAVRGALTRNYLMSQGITCPEIYGDPAQLLPLIYPCKNRKKIYKMGVIPHYRDLKQEAIVRLIEEREEDVIIINLEVYTDWKNVIEQLCECDFIVSSSLHGLILADAYNIPNVWIRLSNNIQGGDFKFKDYFSGCGRTDVQPLNLIGKNLNYKTLSLEVKKYRKPVHDNVSLLKVCPFLSNKQINKWISEIE